MIAVNTDSHHPRLKSTLKKSGYSLTAPRKSVFEALLEGPVTHAELAYCLKGTIDRATTYRTLDLFERLGIANRVWQGTKSRFELSEIFLPHHHHATCQRCGRVIDLMSPDLEQLLSRLARKNGFLTVEHSVELSGYCANCH